MAPPSWSRTALPNPFAGNPPASFSRVYRRVAESTLRCARTKRRCARATYRAAPPARDCDEITLLRFRERPTSQRYTRCENKMGSSKTRMQVSCVYTTQKWLPANAKKDRPANVNAGSSRMKWPLARESSVEIGVS